MHDRMGITAQGHQDANNSFQMQACSHTTDLGVNATQSGSTACTSVGFPVLNDSVDKPIDFCVGQCIPRVIAESSECLCTNRTDNWISIGDKFLNHVSYIHLTGTANHHSLPAKVPAISCLWRCSVFLRQSSSLSQPPSGHAAARQQH